MKIRDSDTDIGRYVLKRVQIFGKFSELPQLRSPRSIEWKNVEGDRPLLGKGAFSNVYRIELAGDDQVYALKRLNSVMPAHDKKFKTGASDLALEVKLLECLDHPNIIQLHGVKSGELEDSINHRDYFLVLDYLICSLDDRLRRWRKESGGIIQKINKRISRKRLVDRVETTALGVAKGMEYLHAKVRYVHLVERRDWAESSEKPSYHNISLTHAILSLVRCRILSFVTSNPTMLVLL